MAYDLEEQEKLDAMKAWWSRHGSLVLTVVVLAAAAVLGWRGWQWYQGHRASQAMGYFEALEDAASQTGQDAVTRVKAASATLREDYAGSPFAARGALVAAKALEAQNDPQGAREQAP